LGSSEADRGQGLAIERKRIEGRIEELGTWAGMGCKAVWSNSAVSEKCHRK
jgi:hypothetical protein